MTTARDRRGSTVREATLRAWSRSHTRPLPKKKLTFKQFLDWADEDTWAEWVNGEVIPMGPARVSHQAIADFLTALLRLYVEAHDLGTVMSAPFLMKLTQSGREPDVIFVRRSRLKQFTDVYLRGPADLVVEVVSPDSRHRDRHEKFLEYEREGVREYWLIDPIREQAEFHRRSRKGSFAPIAVANGVFRSAVLKGLWLEVAWLWQKPMPTLMSVLKAWKLVT